MNDTRPETKLGREYPPTPDSMKRAIRGMFVGKRAESEAMCVMADAMAEIAWQALCDASDWRIGWAPPVHTDSAIYLTIPLGFDPQTKDTPT